ncbi:hypothetical protein GCM10022243_38150 [Saccharothrix violaceirubra]|uniref:Uncharacterized protein n=1 Tax=Saccharothrix violaceirubra TaxID=413306 RepID=A0A7W7WWM7_9PSEU|nr:hypothetical protein [Saccharothrix violaceirubra]MBB4966271.1 hypothetical protein [Saccharothrix violaceirubra]
MTEETVMRADLRGSASRDVGLLLRELAVGEFRNVVLVVETASLTTQRQDLEKIALKAGAAILVVVGPVAAEHGPVLDLPSVLSRVAAVLWVGADEGVRWTGGSQPAGPGRAGLDDLLRVLDQPKVFRKVREEVLGLPHQTASPGLEVEYLTVDPVAAGEVKAEVLRRLVAVGPATRSADHESTALKAFAEAVGAPPKSAGFVPGSPLAAVEGAAADRLAAASRALAPVAGVRGLLGRNRMLPKAALAAVADAVENQFAVAKGTIADIDTSLGRGVPPPTELVERGLPVPERVDHDALTGDLRAAVAAELRAKRTLRSLAAQAQKHGSHLGVSRGLVSDSAVTLPDPGPVVDRLRAPAACQWLPSPQSYVWLAALGTAAAAGWLPAIGRLLGPLVVLLWVVCVAWACHRLPAPATGARWAAASTGVVGAIGCACGLLSGPVPLPSAVAAAAGVVLVLAVPAIVAAAWHRSVTRWVRGLGLREVGELSGSQVRQYRTAISERWITVERRSGAANALFVLSEVLEVVAEAYKVVVDDHDRGPFRPVPQADTHALLTRVFEHDLVELVLTALEKRFAGIAAGVSYHDDRAVTERQVRDLLGDYQDHLKHRSVVDPPPGVPGGGPRDDLAAGLRRAVPADLWLWNATARDRLTQLCLAGDLRLLDLDGSAMVHVAPPESAGATGAAAVEDVVGALRLTPLRPGLVAWTVDTAKGGRR